MGKLTKEEVLHVAHLARIAVSDEEIERYSDDLGKLLDEVNKINDVKEADDDLLITPIDHVAHLREDENKNSIKFADAKRNIPRVDGNFVEVPVMINE